MAAEGPEMLARAGRPAHGPKGWPAASCARRSNAVATHPGRSKGHSALAGMKTQADATSN